MGARFCLRAHLPPFNRYCNAAELTFRLCAKNARNRLFSPAQLTSQPRAKMPATSRLAPHTSHFARTQKYYRHFMSPHLRFYYNTFFTFCQPLQATIFESLFFLYINYSQLLNNYKPLNILLQKGFLYFIGIYIKHLCKKTSETHSQNLFHVVGSQRLEAVNRFPFAGFPSHECKIRIVYPQSGKCAL